MRDSPRLVSPIGCVRGHRGQWDAMIDHRTSLRDLSANHMPAAVFGRYLHYEHDFVRTAISIFGFALARAPSFSDQVHLIGVLHVTGCGAGWFFRQGLSHDED